MPTRISWAWLAGVGLFSAYNLFLLTDHHLIRVSLINVVEIRDTGWLEKAPTELIGRFQFEPAPALETFESPVELPPAGSAPPIVRARQVFANVVDWLARTDTTRRCWNAESPQLIAANLLTNNCRGFCGDYAILMAAIAQKAGIPARRVVMEGADRMGGGTHVVTELWLDDLGQWVMFDAYHFAMLRDSSGRYLSTLEARRLLLGGNPERAILEQLTENGALLRGQQVLDYYQSRMPDLQFPANSDLVAQYQRSVIHRSVSWAEQFLAESGSRAMMPARFLGRLLQTRIRYRVLDDLAPESYAPRGWFLAYRILLGVFALSLAGLALAGLRAAPASSRLRA